MTDPLFARFGREFSAGDVLFHEGETGEEMYVIQEGVIQISKAMGTDVRPIATLGKGEFLGELAILNGKPRNATAIVLEDAKCLVIDRSTLETMVAKNPEIAMRLIKKLARRLDSADALIQILLNPDPKARALAGLRRHAEAFGEPAKDGRLRVHLTPAVLAQEVGAERGSVDDVMSRLRRIRIVEPDPVVEGDMLVDLNRLLEFLEFLETPKRFEAS
jgi:CRP-like cAMP-binding protein